MEQGDMFDTDDLYIDDVKITRQDIIKNINFRLRQRWTPDEQTKGKEINVWTDWKDLLKEDGSILQEYKKYGWIVFHYQQTNNKGDIIREWICFQRPNILKGK